MDVAIMIEGQDGLTWPRWQAIAAAVEELGFAGLYRSDHFTNANPRIKIRSNSGHRSPGWLPIRGASSSAPLVTPVSFRDPVFTARIAKDVGDLSGGRLILGVGAGWQEREHHMFGYDLMPPAPRFARFEEGLDVITHLLQNPGRVNHSGNHYTLRDAMLLPRPQRPGGPPILIGGNGPRRTLPLVARYAHEWNGVYITAERFAALNQQLDTLLAAQGREPGTVRRSLMTNVIFGSSETTLRDKLAGRDADALRQRGLIVGTPPAVRDQLQRLAEAGVQRVMLQWLDQDDLAGLEALAQAVL